MEFDEFTRERILKWVNDWTLFNSNSKQFYFNEIFLPDGDFLSDAFSLKQDFKRFVEFLETSFQNSFRFSRSCINRNSAEVADFHGNIVNGVTKCMFRFGFLSPGAMRFWKEFIGTEILRDEDGAENSGKKFLIIYIWELMYDMVGEPYPARSWNPSQSVILTFTDFECHLPRSAFLKWISPHTQI